MAEGDFQEKSNNEEVKANYTAKGLSGTFVTGNIIQDDYLSELIGVEGQKQYVKMSKSDAQIRKLMHAVNNPIKSADWAIEPASDEKVDIEQAALMEQILFKDIEGGWAAKLDEILTFPWQGHSVFEIIHKNRQSKTFGPYTGLENLAWRDQTTLTKWDFQNGRLKRVYQEQSGELEVNAWLESDTLLTFYNEKKGNDNGFAFLRMLYGNYKRKLLYKQLQAIGMERAAIAVPHLELPQGVPYDSDEATNAENQLRAFTLAETAYFITPYGYKLNYNNTGNFDPARAQVAIKAENEEIAGSLIGMWLEMGIGGNSGNQAGTGISAEFFKDGIEYIADKISSAINLRLIPNLMALNFGEVENLPKLRHSGIADEAGKELMEIVTGYSTAGIITPDEPLEDHIRKTHNLPKKAEGEMLENKKASDETPGKEKPEEAPQPKKDEEDKELSEKDNVIELASKSTPKTLIDEQSAKTKSVIVSGLEFVKTKYIKDVMNKYKQLPDNKKQNATTKITLGGVKDLNKKIKKSLVETTFKAIDQAKSEVPSRKDISLKTTEEDMIRLNFKGDEIKLNEQSKLPTHMQILLSKQAQLMAENASNELKKRIDFKFSGMEVKTNAEDSIKQALEDEADKYIDSPVIGVQATNANALFVNESRNSFFNDEDVIDEIHSFTFVNIAPKSAICRELAGTTFKTNDVDSLRYSPPLHHNCKSYLRANLKVSKGVDKIEVSSLSPSAEAKKSITL